MSRAIAGQELKKIVLDGEIIKNAEPSNCGAIKYDFTLGDSFLSPQYGGPRKFTNEKQEFIHPGEVVYVLTNETLELPPNMYMILSQNRGMSESGMLTLGGFAVDPGYKGKLIFGLYNYSNQDFPLIKGRKLVGGVFHELVRGKTEELDIGPPPKSVFDFPGTLVTMIQKYSSTGVNSLERALKAIQSQVEQLERTSDRNIDKIAKLEVVAELNNGQIAALTKNVDGLLESFQGEAHLRQQHIDALDKRIEVAQKELESKVNEADRKISKRIHILQGVAWLLTAFGSIIVALVIGVLTGLITIN